jgi:hypothetical protein
MKTTAAGIANLLFSRSSMRPPLRLKTEGFFLFIFQALHKHPDGNSDEQGCRAGNVPHERTIALQLLILFREFCGRPGILLIFLLELIMRLLELQHICGR